MPAVTLRRTGTKTGTGTKGNAQTTEDQIKPFLRFVSGEIDTLTLVNVEVLEQTMVNVEIIKETTDPSYKVTSQPRQDLGPSTTGVLHSGTAVRDEGLPEESLDRLSDTHSGSFRIRRMHEQSTMNRKRSRLPRAGISTPEGDALMNCRACFDTMKHPIYLDCGHTYCRLCLNELVRVGTANRIQWPPTCCFSGRPMDVSSIRQHLDEEVLSRYLEVSEEYSTRNPIYCSNKFCSLHIPPSQIEDNKEKFVLCSKCRAETCVECKQGRSDHVGIEGTTCKSPEALMDERDCKLARSKQWKQCPSCKNLVERTEGCDQIRRTFIIDFTRYTELLLLPTVQEA
ncbi:hypothetical protein Z517_02609 [Fonsecaea pedrosoi CBS 271.37]|uniref:RBR-type E3 ubiquitin transferase n=1 Tax=Fonsecaea pedrosoi CBS 271.37 TaxID=1442368 RepID=A0A0D2HFZ8_9EURO|nr:uncharacterized protein Z517_02609 [Fonsecaea pedrosoi CBS 271.37]KIW83364.1 hypothetical protein Z517_02609 [Fonsecaea pedrosoi CBS 271.37]